MDVGGTPGELSMHHLDLLSVGGSRAEVQQPTSELPAPIRRSFRWQVLAARGRVVARAALVVRIFETGTATTTTTTTSARPHYRRFVRSGINDEPIGSGVRHRLARRGVPTGVTVVVVGDGAVGLSGVLAASQLGARNG